MEDDDKDLDEMVRLVSERWAGTSPQVMAINAEERAIAEKLMGKGNARRLASTPSGKRFKYLKPKLRRSAEFYHNERYGWVLLLLINGKRRAQVVDLSREGLDNLIAKLTAKGIKCGPVAGEDLGEPDKPERPHDGNPTRPSAWRDPRPPAVPSARVRPSGRRDMLKALSGFRT